MRRAGSARALEGRFDLRVPFAVERRLLPVLLLVGLVAAASATAVGAPALVWSWFALYAVNSAARYLLATTYGDARQPIPTDARCARQYLACSVADVLLWAALFAANAALIAWLVLGGTPEARRAFSAWGVWTPMAAVSVPSPPSVIW